MLASTPICARSRRGRCRKTLCAIDIVGTASKSAPGMRKKCSPTRSEKNDEHGMKSSPRKSPMIFGLSKFASGAGECRQSTQGRMSRFRFPRVSPTATAGTALAIDPKMGTSENTAASSAMTGQYFQSDDREADRAYDAVDAADEELLRRTTPESPSSMRAARASKAPAAVFANERPKEIRRCAPAST